MLVNNQPQNQNYDLNKQILFGKNKLESKKNDKLSPEENIKQSDEMLDITIQLINESNDIMENTIEQTKTNTQKIKKLGGIASDVTDQATKGEKSLKNIELRRRFYGLLDWVPKFDSSNVFKSTKSTNYSKSTK